MRNAILAVVLLSAPVAASAESTIKDNSVHERAQTLDVVGSVGFFGDFYAGIGAWYAYPILPDGFIEPINDSFWIEGGGFVDHYWWSYFGCDGGWSDVSLLPGVRWMFHLNSDWDVFATAKLGVGIGFGSSFKCGGVTVATPGRADGVFPAYEGGVGAYWNFSSDWHMRFDLGYRTAVGAGTQL